MTLFNFLIKKQLTQIVFIFLLVTYNLLDTVECSSMDPNIVSLSDGTQESFSDEKEETSHNEIDSEVNSAQIMEYKNIPSDLPSTNINVNVTTDIPTIVNTTLENVGKIVTSPAVVGASASLGTAAILKQLPAVLKTLPPNQRTGVALGVGLATSVGQIFNNVTKTLNQESNELASVAEASVQKLEMMYPEERTGSPDSMKNDFINSPLENDFYFIPSIFEFTSSLEALATGMLIGSVGTFYMVLTMLLSFSIRLFNLESKEFVTKRPKLHKWLSLVAKGRDSTTLILIILILIVLGEMVYGSYLLLYIIHSKSI